MMIAGRKKPKRDGTDRENWASNMQWHGQQGNFLLQMWQKGCPLLN
jgi:hypothetical protein